jgi:hypothetical protein
MGLAAFVVVAGVTACYRFCITASTPRPFASCTAIGQIAMPWVGILCPDKMEQAAP